LLAGLADENFREKLTAVLVRAGLPIAPTFDPTLSSGLRVQSDSGRTPPACFLHWRVHPSLIDHFLSLSHAELLDDPQVQAMRNTQRAMNTAITTILEFAGYQVREDRGERIGELFVTKADGTADV
jgi:hypothetical protein